MSTATSVVGGLTLAGILAGAPFGIPVEHIAVGTCFAIVGVTGRAAFEAQKAAEGSTGGIQLSKILFWLGSGFVGAPFVTIVFLTCLNLANVKSDGIVLLGLLFLGFSGPRMVTWLLNTAVSLFNKKTGFNLPSVDSVPTQPPAPPGP